MSTLLFWDLFPQHECTRLSWITSAERAAWLPVISSVSPWGAAEDLHFYPGAAAAYGWLTPLSPTEDWRRSSQDTIQATDTSFENNK